MSENFRKIVLIVFELRSFLSVGMGMEIAGMWYLSKHFLSSANISLSIHNNEKITRRLPLLKSNST